MQHDANRMPSKLRMRRLLVWLVALMPVVVVLGFGGYHVAGGPDCAACHDDSGFVEATSAAPHASVECASCHVPIGGAERVVFGFRQAFHMTLPIVDGDGREWASVPDARCLSCHETVLDATASKDGIRIDHATCAEGASCSSCHSTTAHGEATKWTRTYDMEACLGCHVPSEVSADCDLCHDGKLREDRVTTGIFKITHGSEWEKTHGMGDALTCTACHTAASCEKCHGVGLPHVPDFVEQHATLAEDSKAKCASCHEPSFCTDCHGLAMPHPNSFVRGHSGEAERDEALCGRCHVDSDCMTCHEKHVHPGGAIGALSSDGGAR